MKENEQDKVDQSAIMTQEQIRQIIRDEIAHFATQSGYVFDRPIQIQNGNDITLGQGFGTRIGTSATQKLSFFGATPRVQLPAGYLIAPTGGTTIDDVARARISDLNNAFTLFGLAP